MSHDGFLTVKLEDKCPCPAETFMKHYDPLLHLMYPNRPLWLLFSLASPWCFFPASKFLTPCWHCSVKVLSARCWWDIASGSSPDQKKEGSNMIITMLPGLWCFPSCSLWPSSVVVHSLCNLIPEGFIDLLRLSLEKKKKKSRRI